MDNKLSELSKPEQFDAAVEIHGGEPFAVWAPAVNGSHVKKEQYFSLLAELEAKDKRIAELEAKLAPPVQLKNCDFESVAIMAHWCTDEQLEAWVKGVEHAKKQIRAAGFKVEGDE